MRILYLSFILIVSDQLTKLIVKGFSIPFLNLFVEGMDYGSSINVIGDFVKLTYVENPGMAFGIEVGDSKLLLSLFSLVASIAILIYLYKVRYKSPLLKLALALIFAGAVGNLIDRMFYGVIFDYAPLFYGKVVDFINVEFFDFTLFGHTYERWPIFNIADASVTVGVFILILFNKKIENYDKENKVDVDVDLETNEVKEIKEDVEEDGTSDKMEDLVVENNKISTDGDDEDNIRKENKS